MHASVVRVNLQGGAWLGLCNNTEAHTPRVKLGLKTNSCLKF